MRGIFTFIGGDFGYFIKRQILKICAVRVNVNISKEALIVVFQTTGEFLNIPCFGIILAVSCVLAGCSKFHRPNDDDLSERFALTVVSNSLVSPKTAEFSSIQLVKGTDDIFIVFGSVDSENAYGAMLQQDWVCVLTNSRPHKFNWIVEKIGGDYLQNTAFAGKK